VPGDHLGIRRSGLPAHYALPLHLYFNPLKQGLLQDSDSEWNEQEAIFVGDMRQIMADHGKSMTSQVLTLMLMCAIIGSRLDPHRSAEEAR